MTITPLDGHTITYQGVELDVDDFQAQIVVDDHTISGILKPAPSGYPFIPEGTYVLLFTAEPDPRAEIESMELVYPETESPIVALGSGNLCAYIPETDGVLRVVSTDGVNTLREDFDLSGLAYLQP